MNNRYHVTDNASVCDCSPLSTIELRPGTIHDNLDILLDVLNRIDSTVADARNILWSDESDCSDVTLSDVIDIDTHIIRCIDVARHVLENVTRINNGLS